MAVYLCCNLVKIGCSAAYTGSYCTRDTGLLRLHGATVARDSGSGSVESAAGSKPDSLTAALRALQLTHAASDPTDSTTSSTVAAAVAAAASSSTSPLCCEVEAASVYEMQPLPIEGIVSQLRELLLFQAEEPVQPSSSSGSGARPTTSSGACWVVCFSPARLKQLATGKDSTV